MAVGDGGQAGSVGHEIRGAAHHRGSPNPPGDGPRSLRGRSGRDGVDATDLGLQPGDGRQLGGVAPDDVNPHRRQDLLHRRTAKAGSAGSHRVEDHRDAAPVGLLTGGDHRGDPRAIEGPDVENQAARMGHHLPHLL
jgi:hypothetical protein